MLDCIHFEQLIIKLNKLNYKILYTHLLHTLDLSSTDYHIFKYLTNNKDQSVKFKINKYEAKMNKYKDTITKKIQR